MREEYRMQLVELGKKALIGAIVGAVIAIPLGIASHFNELLEFFPLMLATSLVGAGMPQGYRMSQKLAGLLSWITILPVLGWIMLGFLQLSVIFYGGLIGTPVMAIYEVIKMQTSNN